MKMKSPLLLSAAVAAAVAVVPHAVYSHQQQSNSISNNDNEHERHSRRRGPLDVSSPAEAADSDSVPAQRPSLRTLRIRPESQVEVAAEVPATAIVAAVLANVTRAEHNVTRTESEPEEEPEYFFAVESKSGKSNKSGKSLSSSSSSAEYIEYYEDLEPGTYILPAHPKVKSGKSAPGLLFDESSEPDTHTILPASAAFPKSGKSAPQLGVYYENSVPKAGKVSGSKSIKTTTTTTSDVHHYYGAESAAFPKSGKGSGSKSSNGYQYYGSESAAFPKSGKAYDSKSSNGYQYYGSESAVFPKSGKKTSGSDSKSGKAYSGKSSKVEYYGANKYTTGDIVTSSPTPDSMNINPTIKAQSETPTKSPIKQPLMLRSEDDINEYACTGKPCAITTWCRSRYGTCGPGRIYCGSYSAWESSCPPVTDSPTTSPSEEPTPFEEGVSANFNSQSLLDPLEEEDSLLNDSEEGALLHDLELGTEDTTSKARGTGTGIDSPEGISASAIMIMGILFCVAVMATGLYYGKKKDEEEMHRALNGR